MPEQSAPIAAIYPSPGLQTVAEGWPPKLPKKLPPGRGFRWGFRCRYWYTPRWQTDTEHGYDCRVLHRTREDARKHLEHTRKRMKRLNDLIRRRAVVRSWGW